MEFAPGMLPFNAWPPESMNLEEKEENEKSLIKQAIESCKAMEKEYEESAKAVSQELSKCALLYEQLEQEEDEKYRELELAELDSYFLEKLNSEKEKNACAKRNLQERMDMLQMVEGLKRELQMSKSRQLPEQKEQLPIEHCVNAYEATEQWSTSPVRMEEHRIKGYQEHTDDVTHKRNNEEIPEEIPDLEAEQYDFEDCRGEHALEHCFLEEYDEDNFQNERRFLPEDYCMAHGSASPLQNYQRQPTFEDVSNDAKAYLTEYVHRVDLSEWLFNPHAENQTVPQMVKKVTAKGLFQAIKECDTQWNDLVEEEQQDWRDKCAAVKRMQEQQKDSGWISLHTERELRKLKFQLKK